jgi:magnesium chelatase family protein
VNALNQAQLQLAKNQSGRPTSAEIKERVVNAREVLSARLSEIGYSLVSHVPPSVLRTALRPSKQVTAVLDSALQRGLVSMRGYDRCVRVGLTIAALDGRDELTSSDLDQSFLLRGPDSLVSAA